MSQSTRKAETEATRRRGILRRVDRRDPEAGCPLIQRNRFQLLLGVNTHCARLARRLGLTRHADPARIERDLMAAFPRRAWGRLTHLLIAHGRALCRARRPRCGECLLAPHCPSAGAAA